MSTPLERFDQGKPVARRGRKARDLLETARLPAQECLSFIPERECFVKAKLTRFTWALTMLAAMALSVGAGMRWDW
jgi:hypothetical protein